MVKSDKGTSGRATSILPISPHFLLPLNPLHCPSSHFLSASYSPSLPHQYPPHPIDSSPLLSPFHPLPLSLLSLLPCPFLLPLPIQFLLFLLICCSPPPPLPTPHLPPFTCPFKSLTHILLTLCHLVDGADNMMAWCASSSE